MILVAWRPDFSLSADEVLEEITPLLYKFLLCKVDM